MRDAERKWLELDHIENAVNDLEMTVHFLTCIDSHWKWKWVIMATHQALYGFLICALKGTAAKLTVTLRDVKKHPRDPRHKIGAVHAWKLEGQSVEDIAGRLNTDASTVEKLLREELYLIGIWTALKRMQDKKWLYHSGCKPLVLTDEEQWALKKLITEFRNEFEHFMPKQWSIEVSGMPVITSHALRVIEYVAIESKCITMREDTHKRIAGIIERVRIALDAC